MSGRVRKNGRRLMSGSALVDGQARSATHRSYGPWLNNRFPNRDKSSTKGVAPRRLVNAASRMPTANHATKLIPTGNSSDKFLSSAESVVPKLRKNKFPLQPRPEVVRVHQSAEGQTWRLVGCRPHYSPKPGVSPQPAVH